MNNNDEKRVKIKIVRPIEIEWECPECHKINVKGYNLIETEFKVLMGG